MVSRTSGIIYNVQFLFVMNSDMIQTVITTVYVGYHELSARSLHICTIRSEPQELWDGDSSNSPVGPKVNEHIFNRSII